MVANNVSILMIPAIVFIAAFLRRNPFIGKPISSFSFPGKNPIYNTKQLLYYK